MSETVYCKICQRAFEKGLKKIACPECRVVVCPTCWHMGQEMLKDDGPKVAGLLFCPFCLKATMSETKFTDEFIESEIAILDKRDNPDPACAALYRQALREIRRRGDRIATLERELEEAEAILPTSQQWVEAVESGLLADNRRLERELESARKDKERLNWLEKRGHVELDRLIGTAAAPPPIKRLRYSVGCKLTGIQTADSYREAIDAARKETK